MSNINIDFSYVDKTGTDYAKFKHWVDLQVLVTNDQYDYAFSATDAAYMYRLDGGQQYATLAIHMAELQVTAYEQAIAAGHVPAIAGDSFLEVGQDLRDVALVYDWCSSLLTAQQKTRYANYCEAVLFNLYNPNNGHWGNQPYTWSGWALTDPANNYYYSHMMAVMHWALAASSATWKQRLQNNGNGTLDKLVAYFATIPHGGSEEGTGYGTSHKTVFNLLKIWKDCTGQDVHGPHVDGSLRYWTHTITPDGMHFAPIGDQSRVSEPTVYDYQLALIASGAMVSVDVGAKAEAMYALAHTTPAWMTQAFNYRDGLMPHSGATTHPTELYYDAVEVGALFNRSDWTPNALWMATVCGHYDQSHAHQQQGSITLRKGPTWITAPANIWSHSGIHQDTPGQNVVRFERSGVVQPQHLNTTCTKSITGTSSIGALSVTMNLSPAYQGVSWMRAVNFTAQAVIVTDTFSGADGILQWHSHDQPVISGNTAMMSGYKVTVLNHDGTPATLTSVNMHTVDPDYGTTWRLEARGTSGGFRTVFGILKPVPSTH